MSPATASVQTMVRLTAEQRDALDRIATEQDRSVAYIIRKAIDAYLAAATS